MLNIVPIPALQDNYIWLLHNEQHAVIIDPGEAEPVLSWFRKHPMQLDAILCTHRHPDHIGGIAELRGVYNVPVYGRSHPKNPHITNDLRDGQQLVLDDLGITFDIMETPGHLDDHIVYCAPGLLFCGDMIFGGACGKNFEGTLAQLHHSIQRMAALPDDTAIYCAHEYTAYNMPFILACEPSNQESKQRMEATRKLRAQNLPTVPFSMGLERATSPFFRCNNEEIIGVLLSLGLRDRSELGIFSALYHLRANFNPQKGLVKLTP